MTEKKKPGRKPLSDEQKKQNKMIKVYPNNEKKIKKHFGSVQKFWNFCVDNLLPVVILIPVKSKVCEMWDFIEICMR